MLAVLAFVNVLLAPGARQYLEARSSLGFGPQGQAALFELLEELGYAPERTYTRPDDWPAERVVWLVDPLPQIALAASPTGVVEEIQGFALRGGTAVIFGDALASWGPLEIESEVLTDETRLIVDPGQRELPLPDPVVFAEAGGYDVLLEDEEGRPFALSAEWGEGRIVAVADARFLSNDRLARNDAAVLAMDLVRGIGPPVLDERFHGLAITPSFLELAGKGRVALVVFAFCALLAAAALWLEPWSASRPLPPETPEATISSFIDVLTDHYAKTRDSAAKFRAYREGLLHRLRRHSGSADGMADAAFRRRLATDPGMTPEVRRWLVEAEAPDGEAGMLRAARILERFVEGGE